MGGDIEKENENTDSHIYLNTASNHDIDPTYIVG